MEKSNYDGKHLTEEKRKIIEECLNDQYLLFEISLIIEKDSRTISKEIKRNRSLTSMEGKRKFINKNTNTDICPKLQRFPYVCNGCKKSGRCTIDHYYYRYREAQTKYEKLLKDSRQGIDLTNDEFKVLDNIIKDGVRKGQSIYAIVSQNEDLIKKTPKTIYTYVHNGCLSTKPIDLRNVCKLKPRVNKNKYNKTLEERKCYIGRKIENYYDFLIDNPGIMPAQIDTVEGTKESAKCLLTIHFPVFHFMLIYLLNSQTPDEVKRIFNEIESEIGLDSFKKLFPCILTDRGKEFTDPYSIEYNEDHVKRTQVFYCDALQSNQKPQIETNHKLIRYVIPKGVLMDIFNDDDILLLSNHINSYPRKELNGRTPYELMNRYYKNDLILKLKIKKVDSKEVNLTRNLLK